MQRPRVLVFFVLVLSSGGVIAENVPPFPSDWTPIEENAWKEIVAGKPVEFAPGEGRKLRASFLRTILTDPVFSRQIPRYGVDIRSALITDELDLSNLEVPCELSFVECHFEGPIRFINTKFGKNLAFWWSVLDSDIHASEAQFREGVSVSHSGFSGPSCFGSGSAATEYNSQPAASYSNEFLG